MKAFRWRSHRVLLASATSAVAVALIVVGVPAAALATHPASRAHPSAIGPGYPPPGGIYTPFTNCPILNPIMAESVESTAACVTGEATSGSITIGNIVTPVVRPVNVQFGFWNPPNATNGGDNSSGLASYAGGILPPPAGIPAMISTQKDLIPLPLTTALGCPSTNPVVQDLCVKAENFGGKYNDVYALATSVGQLTNFALFSWTQRVAFKLVNPLLGNNCYIGSANNPVVLNPQLTAPNGVTITYDPNPVKHPDTGVIEAPGAIASDTTFSAPGVTGCGPGGAKNIPVDLALDAGAGLPAASGVNSLTLNGNFYIAASTPGAPLVGSKVLLSAFKDSSKSAGARESVRRISAASPNKLRGIFGLK